MFGFLTISHTICTCQWFPLKGKEENKLSVQILKATKIHGMGCKILKPLPERQFDWFPFVHQNCAKWKFSLVCETKFDRDN